MEDSPRSLRKTSDPVASEHAPALTDANHAYANIVPRTYVQSENPFDISGSAYCRDASGKEIPAANDFNVAR